jgi:hypothetical protein
VCDHFAVELNPEYKRYQNKPKFNILYDFIPSKKVKEMSINYEVVCLGFSMSYVYVVEL